MDSAEKKRSPLFINSFVLKILALLTMTIDHLFVCFGEFSSQFPNDLYMIGSIPKQSMYRIVRIFH